LLGLPDPESGTVSIQPGQAAWFRVSTLDPAISQALTRQPDGWLASLPRRLAIGKVTWQQQKKVPGEAATWNRLVRYADLAAAARPRWKWRLCLETPTSFSGEFSDFTIPLPELLITSWLKRWNRFAPGDQPPIPEKLIEIARSNLRLVEYDLQTRPGERSTTGCVGSLTIQAFDLEAETRRRLDLLFRYAFFCGSGHRTAQGMGLTRPLEED
jgi:CRISPR/Cas system endoribonuclease Cas6 (RAMP superfamily)